MAKATGNKLAKSLLLWRIESNQHAHLELYHKNPDTLRGAGHIAKPNRIILNNYREKRAYVSCERAI